MKNFAVSSKKTVSKSLVTPTRLHIKKRFLGVTEHSFPIKHQSSNHGRGIFFLLLNSCQ